MKELDGVPDHLVNDIRRGFVNISGNDDVVNNAERKLRLGSALTVGIWLSLLVAIINFAPAESYEKPEGLDRDSHLLTALLLFVVTCARILQMLLKERGASFFRSGIVLGTLCVQTVAIISNLTMALYPCPVLYDEVTGQRSHAFRYAEWVALAFLMVFLTDNIDSKSELRFQTAIFIGVSTLAGLVLPLCKKFSTWMLVFGAAVVLFCDIYFLLYRRVVRLHRIRNKMIKRELQLTAAEHEQYEIARSSFLLTLICSTAWTFLVVSYVCVCFLHLYLPAEYIPEAALSLHSCVNEVISKIWYLSTLLEAYDNIFDVNTRVSRRLEELRRFMSAIWQSSSDTIVFCVAKEANHISARVSPAFLTISGLKVKGSEGCDVSFLLDIYPDSGTFTMCTMDLSKPFSKESASFFRKSLEESVSTKYSFRTPGKYTEHIQNVAALAKQVAETVTVTDEKDGQADNLLSFHSSGKVRRCETKISNLHDGCMVLVLRDISDRIERFEIEKKLVEEKAVRSKDAETNHFTRHEVKNGILASIGLLDHMRECMKKKLQDAGGAREMMRTLSNGSLGDVHDPNSGVIDTLEELDSTLHDVLDTILDEVMAREIVYGEYKPRKERINVSDVLATIRRGSTSRFPVEMDPVQFPLLVLDRQLLRHIYRNAVSNACRYGKQDGTVRTLLRYDDETKVLSMKVINEPGYGHDMLRKLSKDEVARVFEKGQQLVATTASMNSVSKALKSDPRKETSGNGAWIMRKCAESLHGDCSIEFKADSTVFEFQCPADSGRLGAEVAAREAQMFGLPLQTQCVVVEDSQVQRKLLDRMLQNSGIPECRRLMLGRDSSEILGFPQKVSEMLQEYPNDFFLLIVDENLDVVPTGGFDVQTLSGSKLVEQLRGELDPEVESRLLTLVRSANDSARDIELYLSRAHGFLRKEPTKMGRFLEAIRPWWTKRFPDQVQELFSEENGRNEEEVFGPLPDDIRTVVDQIHSLCSNPDMGVLARRWSVIREKLQSLKGDLKTMNSNQKVLEVIDELTSLQMSKRFPDNYTERWRALRAKIEELL